MPDSSSCLRSWFPPPFPPQTPSIRHPPKIDRSHILTGGGRALRKPLGNGFTRRAFIPTCPYMPASTPLGMLMGRQGMLSLLSISSRRTDGHEDYSDSGDTDARGRAREPVSPDPFRSSLSTSAGRSPPAVRLSGADPRRASPNHPRLGRGPRTTKVYLLAGMPSPLAGADARFSPEGEGTGASGVDSIRALVPFQWARTVWIAVELEFCIV